MLYGAFATLPIFLIWLYLGWVIVLCDPMVTPAAPLVARFLVAPTAALDGFWKRADFDAMKLADLVA